MRAPWRRWPPTNGSKKEAAPKGGCLGLRRRPGPDHPQGSDAESRDPTISATVTMAVVVKDAPAAKGGSLDGFKGKAATKAAVPTTFKAAAPIHSGRTVAPHAHAIGEVLAALAALADAVVVSPAVVVVRNTRARLLKSSGRSLFLFSFVNLFVFFCMFSHSEFFALDIRDRYPCCSVHV